MALPNSTRGAVGFNYPATIADPDEVFSNTNPRDLQIWIRALETRPAGSVPVAEELRITVLRGGSNWRSEVLVAGKSVEIHSVQSGNLGAASSGTVVADLAKLAEIAAVLRDTLYVGSFRNAINIGSDESYYDIKTGQAFVKEWRRLKTGSIKKEKEAAFRLTQDIQSLFGFGSLEINASLDENTLEILVDGRSYRLSEMGSGLAQFVLTLASAATRQPRPSLILIDEPEISLHPTLQLDFLTTLASHATYGTVFATHVIGLARSSAEAIFTTTRAKRSSMSSLRPYEKTPSLAALLGELSYSGYQALGFDTVLVVEGITDVKTIQQFLRAYGKEHQVLVVPGGGSELFSPSYQDQLLEVKSRVTSKVSVLIDSEKNSSSAKLSAPRARFEQACRKNRIAYHVLDRRAIENYLTQRALDAELGPGFVSLAPFERLGASARPWPKEKNWQIARSMTRSELANSDLGKFLAAL